MKTQVFFTLLQCLLVIIACNAHDSGDLFDAIQGQGDAVAKLSLKKLQGDISSSLAFSSKILENMAYKALAQAQGMKEHDKISKLPGQLDNVDFEQYGGYVTIDEVKGKALYYYFVEATGANASKPLLLWLNGGPGCSSFGIGALTELGPFRVMSDGKTLFRNPYAWNQEAHVLFLESPVGTGFSYSNDTSEYGSYGDQKAAEENYMFLLNWLERFPEYKSRDFYIAGESYAGHYVPQLATLIHQHKLLNLKGIMIGNPAINDETDNRGMYDALWDYALISDETMAAIHKHCNFSSTSQSEQCSEATNDAYSQTRLINRYNIFASGCSSPNQITPTPKTASIENFDPCIHHYVTAYLNNAEVQKALHAYVPGLNRNWTACSGHNWNGSATTVLPLLKELISNNISVLVYSGDVDAVVPAAGTRYSLNQLGVPLIEDSSYLWLIDDQVGGFVSEYEGGLKFATVRGAGHEVPSYQPQRALELIKNFLQGTELPSQEFNIVFPPPFPPSQP